MIFALEPDQSAAAIDDHLQRERAVRHRRGHVELAAGVGLHAGTEQSRRATLRGGILTERHHDAIIHADAGVLADPDRHLHLAVGGQPHRGRNTELDVDAVSGGIGSVRRAGLAISRHGSAAVGLSDPRLDQRRHLGRIAVRARGAELLCELLGRDRRRWRVGPTVSERALANESRVRAVQRRVLGAPRAGRRAAPDEHTFARMEPGRQLGIVARDQHALFAQRCEVIVRDGACRIPVRRAHPAGGLVRVRVDPPRLAVGPDLNAKLFVRMRPPRGARVLASLEGDDLGPVRRGLILEPADIRRVAEIAARRVARLIDGVLARSHARHRLIDRILTGAEVAAMGHRTVVREQDELYVRVGREPLLEAAVAVHDAAEAVADVEHLGREVRLGFDDGLDVSLELGPEHPRRGGLALRCSDDARRYLIRRLADAATARAFTDDELVAVERHPALARGDIVVLDREAQPHALGVREGGGDGLGVTDPEPAARNFLLETGEPQLELREAPVLDGRGFCFGAVQPHLDLRASHRGRRERLRILGERAP
ncbi:MAG: hypothetical protein ABI678_10135, partial [Kofleriaceae bacterium]